MTSSARRLRCTIAIEHANRNAATVAIAGGVDAVGDHPRKPSRVASQCTSTSYAHRRWRDPSGMTSAWASGVEPLDVTPHRGGVREPRVRDEHGLGTAQMRVRRHHRLPGALCLMRQRLDESSERALHPGDPPAQVQPEIDGHLLVARSARMQAAAGVANTRDELALDERVHPRRPRSISVGRR